MCIAGLTVRAAQRSTSSASHPRTAVWVWSGMFRYCTWDGAPSNDRRYRSINAPPTGNTFDAWQAAAVKVGASEQTVRLTSYQEQWHSEA